MKEILKYNHHKIGNSLVIQADCIEWMESLPENYFHAIVTDPPYGLKEYQEEQLLKRHNGNGGVWRLPPAFDGHKRSPLPRFTALNEKERDELFQFFKRWGIAVNRTIRPGGNIFIATNAFIAQLLYNALVEGGLEFRGQIVRLVRTMRGGDRPKNAEKEFPDVSSLPRGCYEPWGLFRKPLPLKMKLSECLREYATGGVRRTPSGMPFEDVIRSQRTPKEERVIAPHPSLKPQAFLRRIVYASLPLGKGIIVDPFMGSGSTIAAAEALGLRSIGVERNLNFFKLAQSAIPKLKIVTSEETANMVIEEENFPQAWLFKQ